MYEHRNPTIGRDMTVPGSIGKKPTKPVGDKKPEIEPIEDKKPDCKPEEEKKPVCEPVNDQEPVEEEKTAPEEEKKTMDPWSGLLFGPPRPKKRVQTEPTDDEKAEQRPGFWWF